MIQSFEKEIKSNKYFITQFPARQNLLFIAKWTKNLKAVAPLLKSLSEESISNLLDTDLASLDFAGMLESFCNGLEPQIFTDLIFDSFKHVKVIIEEKPQGISLGDGNNFDMFFAGKIDHLFFVLWEILKINIFGDNTGFFSEITTKVKTIQKAKNEKGKLKNI